MKSLFWSFLFWVRKTRATWKIHKWYSQGIIRKKTFAQLPLIKKPTIKFRDLSGHTPVWLPAWKTPWVVGPHQHRRQMLAVDIRRIWRIGPSRTGILKGTKRTWPRDGIFPKWAESLWWNAVKLRCNEKNTWLFTVYKGWNPTQLCGDNNKSL